MVSLDKNSPVSINSQIVEQIKLFILKGVLKEGDKLDSVRQLSADLIVNPNTIQKAYRELELLGYVETQAGRGVFVKSVKNIEIESYRDKIIKNYEKNIKDLIELGLTVEELKNIIDGVV